MDYTSGSHYHLVHGISDIIDANLNGQKEHPTYLPKLWFKGCLYSKTHEASIASFEHVKYFLVWFSSDRALL